MKQQTDPTDPNYRLPSSFSKLEFLALVATGLLALTALPACQQVRFIPLEPQPSAAKPPALMQKEELTALSKGVLNARSQLERLVDAGMLPDFRDESKKTCTAEEVLQLMHSYVLRRVDLSVKTSNSALANGQIHPDAAIDLQLIGELGAMLEMDDQTRGALPSPFGPSPFGPAPFSSADASSELARRFETLKLDDESLYKRAVEAVLLSQSAAMILYNAESSAGDNRHPTSRLVLKFSAIIQADLGLANRASGIPQSAVRERLENDVTYAAFLQNLLGRLEPSQLDPVASVLISTYSLPAAAAIQSDFALFSAVYRKELSPEAQTQWDASNAEDKLRIFSVIRTILSFRWAGTSPAPVVTAAARDITIGARFDGPGATTQP